MPAGQPVLELLGIPGQRAARVGVQVEIVEQGRQFDGDNALELAHPGGHQVVDDAEGTLKVTVEEVLHDEDAVVDLALELDLFRVRLF